MANACERKDAKVLILGAGMAGIAAAYSLQQNGTSDFIILEAQDRVGGRMRTDSFAGLHVNAGAAWMQGLDPKHPERCCACTHNNACRLHAIPFLTINRDCQGIYRNTSPHSDNTKHT